MTGKGFNRLSEKRATGPTPKIKGPKMATHTLKVKLNIGDDDVKRGFPKASAGELITVEDNKIAEHMIRKGWAETFDAEKEEREHQERVRRDAQRVRAEVESRKAREEAEKEAEKMVDEERQKIRAVPKDIRRTGEEVSTTDEAAALNTIGQLRNKSMLQNLIDNDPRPAVKEAARKRLAAL